MQCLVEIGMNAFLKLKKLRIEHLSGIENDQTYNVFLQQLSQNQTLRLIKLEQVFTDDSARFAMLVDAISKTRVKKFVCWLARCCKSSSQEASKQCTPTDQLCSFVSCTSLQIIKTRSSDVRSKIDLAKVLLTVQKMDSQLRELHVTEWTFTA